MSHIFISYSHEDRDYVGKLSAELDKRWISHWYDKKMQPGVLWYSHILMQIHRSKAMIVVYSKNASGSEWVEREYQTAIALGKKVYTILLDATVEPPEELPSRQRVLATNSDPESDPGVQRLLDQIEKDGFSSSLWDELLIRGLDILVSVKTYNRREEMPVDGIGLHSFEAAQFLLQNLLIDFHPYLQNSDAVAIVPMGEDGAEYVQSIERGRNQVILGGPGALPYVRELLSVWDEKNSGYCFEVHTQRFYSDEAYIKHVDPQTKVGIRDRVSNLLYDVSEPTPSTRMMRRANYGVIYTTDLSDRTKSGHTIILAAFNRDIVLSMVKFLLDAKQSSSWLKAVEQLESCTETLVGGKYTNNGHVSQKVLPRRMPDKTT